MTRTHRRHCAALKDRFGSFVRIRSSAKHTSVTLASARMVSPACGWAPLLIVFKVDCPWWACLKVGHVLRAIKLSTTLTHWERLQPLNLSLKPHFYVVAWFTALCGIWVCMVWYECACFPRFQSFPLGAMLFLWHMCWHGSAESYAVSSLERRLAGDGLRFQCITVFTAVACWPWRPDVIPSIPCAGTFNNTGSVSDAGRGLQGTLTVTPPFMRKRVIQQLLVGDLADLADEGLYQLLPSGSKKLHAGKKNELTESLAKSKQQTLNPSPWKKSQTNRRHVGKSGLAEDTLCYVSLEQRVFHQLKQSHAESQLVQALRDTVFPELNLMSYLSCKSDLALPTIRHILRGRPTDEAAELDRSLTKALMNERKTSTPVKKTVPMTDYAGLPPVTVSRKPQSQGYPHPWLLPMEWED